MNARNWWATAKCTCSTVCLHILFVQDCWIGLLKVLLYFNTALQKYLFFSYRNHVPAIWRKYFKSLKCHDDPQERLNLFTTVWCQQVESFLLKVILKIYTSLLLFFGELRLPNSWTRNQIYFSVLIRLCTEHYQFLTCSLDPWNGHWALLYILGPDKLAAWKFICIFRRSGRHDGCHLLQY